METQIDGQEDDIVNPVKTVIYGVLQEALDNISKHSKRTLVKLSLQKKEGMIEFAIQDHGQGFDANVVLSQKNYEKGLGLSGMRENSSFWRILFDRVRLFAVCYKSSE